MNIARFIATAVLIIRHFTDGQCPEAFEHDSVNGMCFFLSEIPASSDSAQRFCGYLQATLPIIHSDAQENAVRQFILDSDKPGTQWHIGLRRTGNANFIWDDGSSPDYIKWLAGQPALTAGYNCVSLNAQQNGWSSNPCTDSHPYICQKKSVTCIAGSAYGPCLSGHECPGTYVCDYRSNECCIDDSATAIGPCIYNHGHYECPDTFVCLNNQCYLTGIPGVDACVAALGPGFEGTGPCEADYTCPVAGEVCINGGEVCCAPIK